MNWIRRKLRTWLGIEEIDKHYHDIVNLGIDVHFKKPHMILIYSRFNGGLIKHIEADFQNLKELNEFVRELEIKYRTKKTIFDSPRNMKYFF
jgi:hypothetical protein